MTPAEPGSPRSIHWRRRWYYTLWVGLLLACLLAWGLWERPAFEGTWTARIHLTVRGFPGPGRAQVWCGTASRWQEAFRGGGIQADLELPSDQRAAVPPIRMALALRRWWPIHIPRRTWDVMVIRLTSAQGESRYLTLSFHQDLVRRVVRPRAVMSLEMDLKWATLPLDAPMPSELP
jgi:hypothetical protein